MPYPRDHLHPGSFSRAIARRDRAFLLWGVFFVALTVGAWLLGTMQLLWMASPPAAFRGATAYGHRHHAFKGSIGHHGVLPPTEFAVSGEVPFSEILLVEVVWFTIGFVAMCVAAFCFSIEACRAARRRTDDYWAKYSKAV